MSQTKRKKGKIPIKNLKTSQQTNHFRLFHVIKQLKCYYMQNVHFEGKNETLIF